MRNFVIPKLVKPYFFGGNVRVGVELINTLGDETTHMPLGGECVASCTTELD